MTVITNASTPPNYFPGVVMSSKGAYLNSASGLTIIVAANTTGVVAQLATNLTSPVFSEFTDVANISVDASGNVTLATGLVPAATRTLNARVVGTFDGSTYTIDKTFTIAAAGVPINTAPVWISSATVNAMENSTATFYNCSATDAEGNNLIYSINGGADAALFTLIGTALSFTTGKNYEIPTDAGANNVYNVTLRVSDGTSNTDLSLAVTVTNEFEQTLSGVGISFVSSLTVPLAAGSLVGTITGRVAGDDIVLAGIDSGLFVLNGAKTQLLVGASDITAGGNYAIELTQSHPDAIAPNTQNFTVAVATVTWKQYGALAFRSDLTAVATDAPGFVPFLTADVGVALQTKTETITNFSTSFTSSGSLGATNRPNTYGPRFAGQLTITGTTGRVFMKVGPTGVPAGLREIRLALGRVDGSVTAGVQLRDGTATGPIIADIPSRALVAGHSMDATGADVLDSQWDSLSQGIQYTFTTDTLVIMKGATNVYLQHILVSDPSLGGSAFGVGPYFVDAVLGVDTNDGLTAGTAWKNIPGDVGAGGNVPIFTLLPGAVVNLKGGQYHRPATAKRSSHIKTNNGGSAGNPITYQSYGGGKAIISGDILTPTGWAAPSVGDPSLLSPEGIAGRVEKYSFGVSTIESTFPCFGDERCYPAQWPALVSIKEFDVTDYGQSGWVRFPSAGASANIAAGTMTIIDPQLSRYDDLVGGFICWRNLGNVIMTSRIATFNKATGTITVTGIADTLHSEFIYCIRWHPMDITQPGQYAWSADKQTMYASLPAGTRSIVQTACGYNVTDRYISFRNLEFARFRAADGSGSTPDGSAFWVDGGTTRNLVIEDVDIHQLQGISRQGAIQLLTNAGYVTMTNLNIYDIPTNSAVRMSGASNITVDGLRVRNAGRTGYYHTGGSNCVGRNLDLCDNSSMHGNGVTQYTGSIDSLVENFVVLNHVLPVTQQDNNSLSHIGNTLRNFVAIGRLPRPGYSDPTGWIMRTDTYMPGSTYEGFIAYYSAGLYMRGGPGEPVYVRNAVIDGLGKGDMSNVHFENCLFTYGSVSSALYQSVAELTAVNPGGPGNATAVGCEWDETVDWNGCITNKMWEFLTRVGTTGTYAARTLGPRWVLPAYGTPITTLGTMEVSSLTVNNKHDAGIPFAAVLYTKPGSTIALASGLGNTDLFTLNKGSLAFAAQAVAGTYTLHITETNGGLSNTQVFTITVTAY